MKTIGNIRKSQYSDRLKLCNNLPMLKLLIFTILKIFNINKTNKIIKEINK